MVMMAIPEQFARFGFVAQKLGVDVGGVAQAMPLFGEAVRHLEIGMSAAGDALAMAADVAREVDWPARFGKLAEAFGTDPAPLSRLFAARQARNVRIELASTDRMSGAAATVRWAGAVPLDEDLACMVLAGVPDASRKVLAERAGLLAKAGNSHMLAARIALGEPLEVSLAVEVDSDPGSLERVLAVAKDLHVGEAQRALLGRVHTLLAVDGSAIVELSPMRDRLDFTWDGARWNTRGWETALRVVTGLHREGATRVGTFQGALGDARVSRIGIGWGAKDPPPAWVWATA